MDTEPMIGDIVHVIHLMECYAAIITDVTEGVASLWIFSKPGKPVPPLELQTAYNSLHSARPTSGSHWIEEHDRSK